MNSPPILEPILVGIESEVHWGYRVLTHSRIPPCWVGYVCEPFKFEEYLGVRRTYILGKIMIPWGKTNISLLDSGFWGNPLARGATSSSSSPSGRPRPNRGNWRGKGCKAQLWFHLLLGKFGQVELGTVLRMSGHHSRPDGWYSKGG